LVEKRKSTSSAHACQIAQSGEGYVGHINHTISGIPCQRWSIKQPHEHAYDDITYFADYAINPAVIVQDVVNYCRNPSVLSSVDAQPWCFTTNENIEKEYCDIPRCKGKRAIYVLISTTTIFSKECRCRYGLICTSRPIYYFFSELYNYMQAYM